MLQALRTLSLAVCVLTLVTPASGFALTVLWALIPPRSSG